MKTADTLYLDCFAGISGNMAVAALLDCGVPLEVLRQGLSGLALGDYTLVVEPGSGNGIAAAFFRVAASPGQPRRDWLGIRRLLGGSTLKVPVRDKAIAIFTILAEAEAKVHGCGVDEVHFHEVGAVDSIIDIVCFAICLDHLGVKNVICSPLPMPSGFVSCEHGLLPLPAPAVCELLREIPVYGVELKQELVTPTGAAMVRAVSKAFGPFPGLTIARVGYGQGSHTLADGRPNLLRAVLGKTNPVREAQEIEVITCNLDDWSPEGFPLLTEKLFALGVLDVVLVPIQMKKGRPGLQLQVICRFGTGWEAQRCILSETTAIGVRYRTEKRWTLPRRSGTIDTDLGPLAVKLVETPRGPALYPEYEDCRRLALEKGLPLKEVYAAVNRCLPFNFKPEDH